MRMQREVLGLCQKTIMNGAEEARGAVNILDELAAGGDEGHVEGLGILEARKDLLTIDTKDLDGETTTPAQMERRKVEVKVRLGARVTKSFSATGRAPVRRTGYRGWHRFHLHGSQQ